MNSREKCNFFSKFGGKFSLPESFIRRLRNTTVQFLKLCQSFNWLNSNALIANYYAFEFQLDIFNYLRVGKSLFQLRSDESGQMSIFLDLKYLYMAKVILLKAF